MAERVLTQTDNGHTVEVKAGDTVTIRLAENPTTGYRWEIVSGPSPSSDDFTAVSAAAGAGGERIFSYTIAGPGTLRIAAVLRRQWEAGAAPQQRFEVTVVTP